MASIKKVDVEDADRGYRWRMRVYMGPSEVEDPETGETKTKRTYVTRTFDRKKAAEKEARRLEKLKETGAYTAPSKEPLEKYLRRWLKEVKKPSLRARTYSDYSGVLRRYIEEPPDGAPPIGKIRVDRLTPAAIQSLYSFLHQEEGLLAPDHPLLTCCRAPGARTRGQDGGSAP